MEKQQYLTISDKIEIMKLACQGGLTSYKEHYREMISLILQDKPASQK